MPKAAVWFALKRSLNCSTDPSEVSDPAKPRYKSKARSGICGCSRSISSLRNVIHRTGRRQSDRRQLPSCSPRSMASSELMNPITHQVVFNDDSKCEIKILSIASARGKPRTGSSGSGFVGTLSPGTPGPRGQYLFQGPGYDHMKQTIRTTATSSAASGSAGTFQKAKGYPGIRSEPVARNPVVLTCQKCGEEFKKLDAAEAHHLSKHAVTELTVGDSSRKIVEMICQASWLKSYTGTGRINRVLKVHNMQRTLAWFEEHREMVKTRASKLSKKHPRCLADGNELLRFHGTVLACSLGADSSGLCGFEGCGVCRILRVGFPSKRELDNSLGIFTASTSGRAMESVYLGNEDQSLRKALMVCRVIAGRVHKPVENFQEAAIDPSRFDSVAGKVSRLSNIEELYVLNPKALLPCFVVICRGPE